MRPCHRPSLALITPFCRLSPLNLWKRTVKGRVAFTPRSMTGCRLVHLDLKSSNVLLDADGTAKVSDVGAAAQLGGGACLGRPVPPGTFAWMAPETILGGARRPRSALGFNSKRPHWQTCVHVCIHSRLHLHACMSWRGIGPSRH